MLNITKINTNDCKAARWRNKGGSTKEVFIDSPTSRLDNFGWRISIADIEKSGPFSFFNGYHRILSLLTGEGIDLKRNDETHRLLPGDTLEFDGTDSISSKLLSGQVQDFNIIFNPDLFDCQIQWIKGDYPTNISIEPYATLIAFTLKGGLSIRNNQSKSYEELSPFEALKVDNLHSRATSFLLTPAAHSHFCLINIRLK